MNPAGQAHVPGRRAAIRCKTTVVAEPPQEISGTPPEGERLGDTEVLGTEPRAAGARGLLEVTRSLPRRPTEQGPGPGDAALGATVLVSPRALAAGAMPATGAGLGGGSGEPARFVERGELGRGGMGRVVLAHDRRLERPVAIKQALADDEAHRARFAREVRLTARLEHPSIVPVHDAGLDEAGQPYYVMRRVEGRPLEELVRQTTTSDERLALVPHVLAATDAAAYAHAQQIIHRDIKPSNILVGRYGETWLIDWGLARETSEERGGSETSRAREDGAAGPGRGAREGGAARAQPDRRASEPAAPPAGEGLTRLGEVVGTPGFVAPEQARGERVGVGADVYSLGATLAYTLTGELIYPDRTPTQLLDKAASDAPIAMPALGQVPSALAAIVAKATASRPEERYGSAAELAADLRSFLTGQLVAAHRYSALERARRWVRRHRAAVSIAAIGALALAAVGGLSLHRVLDERDRAGAAEKQAQRERDVAERRSEQLLLERARVLATSHPTAALATLKLLPAHSSVWPAAWGIAAQAMARGVSFGLAPHGGDAYVLAFSPDGARLLSGGDDGLVQLHELTTRRSRPLAREARRIAQALWRDDDHLIYSTDRELVALELSSGRATRRPIAATHWHLLASGAVRYLVDDALYELDGQLAGEPRLVRAPVKDLLGGARGSAVVTGEALVWIDEAGASRTLADYREPYLIAALDGDRLAWSDLRQVHELALAAPAAAPRTLPREKIVALAYSPAGLCLSTARSSWLYAGEQRARAAELAHQAQLRALLPNPRGCTFVEQNGRALVSHDRRTLEVPVPGAAVLAAAASARGAAFAVSHRGGELEVWPMVGMPALAPMQLSSLSLVGHSDRALYFCDFDQLFAVSRQSGETRALTRAAWSAGMLVFELSAQLLLAFDVVTKQLYIIELPSGAIRHRLDGVTAINAGERAGHAHGGELLIARGGELSWFDPGSGALAALRSLDEPIVALGARGDYAVAQGERRTWRLDLRDPRSAPQLLPVEDRRPAAIDASGVAWMASRRGVVRWQDGATLEIPLPAEPTELLQHRWLGLLALDRTGKLHVIDAAGKLVRTTAVVPSAILSEAQPFAVWMPEEGETVVLGDVMGGERVTLPIGRAPATTLLVDSDGSVVIVNLLEREVMTFPPLLPARSEELPGWLATATNAELSADSPAPTWRFSP